MARTTRRPPFGATKKTSETHAKERTLKNRIHELEREVLKISNDRQRVVETNVKLADEIRVMREQRDSAVESAGTTQASFRAAMDHSFSRGDLNQAKNDVIHVVTSIVEAFGRGLAAGKVAP